jgi:UDP-N-acetylglucosamine transferase subunit ALG13
MAEIFVTVGMSDYPFDRLTAALAGVAREHEVFAQIGASSVVPACPWERYLPVATVMDKIASADVVVTHAGNTVRLVQRQGKVPIAVARQARFGEMNNDHQVEYLRFEEGAGPVVAVWDLSTLSQVVRDHADRQARLLLERPAPPAPDPDRIRRVMGGVVDEILARPRRTWLRPRRPLTDAEGPPRGEEIQ